MTHADAYCNEEHTIVIHWIDVRCTAEVTRLASRKVIIFIGQITYQNLECREIYKTLKILIKD